ncbi:Calpain-8 [Cytospora mali]|uniref:Calpain-8 n=1 Tax=Cytospora mali TaxID=578113 RepID=A0A194WCJ4_CYTMA|nr:Calpain-8 [Valsa mali]
MSVTSSSISDVPPQRHSRSRKRRPDPQTPQQKIDQFWSKYKTKAPGKATSIIPQDQYAERAAKRATSKALGPAKTTQQSYEEAAAQCRHKVAQIVKECRRVNQKYRDPHFDLEIDLKLNRRDCLDSLDNVKDDDRLDDYCRDPPLKDRYPCDAPGSATIAGLLGQVDRDTAAPENGDGGKTFRPQAVKRVVDIFDDPKFYIDGPTANDVRQGRDGDCWLMAALCTISNKPGLIERCCVAHDQEVGVYGFVFHRDGEWFSEIIDDKLYLTKPDYDESLVERILWEDRERVNSEEAYRKIYQSNSGALYFAQCENPNETWLPLLEKAYAKAHGDYSAIEGGYGGEGIEDLTGGVTSEIYTTDILDKEAFWKDELMKVNQDFLFGCSTGVWGRGWGERKGIVELHAYSVLKAREIDGMRLVLLKNPWGKHEWKGAWSDGSKEWTAEWLQKLEHKFGDDGSFWISYEDLLKKYQAFDRTRLFGPEWKVASIWTTLNVSWTLDYHDTKFALSLAKPGPVVLVCSQLDERYFKGLEGQYRFELSFRLHKAGEEDYVVRSQSYYRMNRSVNVELDLEAGEYVVVVKIDAQRNETIMPVEEVVRAYAKERREKLLRIGLAYDLAHSKGNINETPEEKAARETYEKRKREKERKKLAKLIRKQREEERELAIRQMARKRKAAEKARARSKARAERRQTRKEAKDEAEEEERKKKEEEEKKGGKKGQKEEGGDLNDKIEKSSTNKPSDEMSDQKDAPAKSKDSEGAEKIQTKGEENQAGTSDEKPSEENTGAESSKDGDSGTEPEENTPASSTILEPTSIEGEETQEDDAYVTAVEDEGESSQPASTEASKAKEDPPTPKAAKFKTDKTKAPSREPKRVDIGVQTGPVPQYPPRMPPLSPPRMHPPPPPGYLHSPPPPPPPGTRVPFGLPYGHSPRGDFHMPPHLRVVPCGPPDVPYASGSDYSMSPSSDGMDDLDSVSEVSEHDIDMYMEAMEKSRAEAARAAKALPSPQQQPSGSRYEDELDEFEKDPWNAVGVFGLRVYYKTGGEEDEKTEMVRLRVERPNPYVLEDDSDDEADDEGEIEDKKKGKGKGVEDDGKEEANESQALDIDDSAKDAVAENVTSEEKKEDKEVLDGKDTEEKKAKKVDDEKGIKQEVGSSSPTQTHNTPSVAPEVVKVEEHADEPKVKKEEGS